MSKDYRTQVIKSNLEDMNQIVAGQVRDAVVKTMEGLDALNRLIGTAAQMSGDDSLSFKLEEVFTKAVEKDFRNTALCAAVCEMS